MVRDDKVGWVHDDVHIGRDGHVGQGHLGWEAGVARTWTAVDANVVYENDMRCLPSPSSLENAFNVHDLLRLQHFYAVVNPHKIPGEQRKRVQERNCNPEEHYEVDGVFNRIR